MKSSLEEMKELMQSLQEGSLQMKSSSCPIEMGELLYVLDSLIHSLGCLPDSMTDSKTLLKFFEFMKNLIRFALFRGLQNWQIEDMSIHVQRLVVDAATLYLKSFCQPEKREIGKMIERLRPVELRVCGIYVRVLEEASKSQSSKHANRGSESIRLDMIDSLTFLLSEALLPRGTRYTGMFDHQIYTLYEGLTFLRTTLKGHPPDRFAKLYDEKMHNIIGVLLCEAGLIACYLFLKIHDNRLIKPLQNLLSEVERKLKLIRETEEEATRYPLKPASCFPQTNLLRFIDSVLVKMESLNLYEAADSVVASEKTTFVTIRDDLAFLRSSAVNFMGQRDQNDQKVQPLWSRIVAVAYETEFVIDSLVVGGAIQSFVGMINLIIEQIKLIKIEASEVSPSLGQITKAKNSARIHKCFPSTSKMPELNEAVVGLDDEARKIIDRLTRGTKQLDIVSIVGMPGLGKTTLAKKVYRHPSIVHYFCVRVWCTVSQEYDKRSLLLEILSGLNGGFADSQSNKSDDDLADAIRKQLKGKSYLVILDDIWDIEPWISLKMSFPDDIKGSRILLTSRNENVTSQIKPQSQSPHSLRSLSKKESWELFQTKIRFRNGCPPELVARGKAIVQRCKGLPLMIMIVVGFLSNMETSSELGSFAEPNMSYRLLISYKREEDFAEPMQVFHYLRTLFTVIDYHYPFDKRRLYHILYKFCRSKLVRVLDLRGMHHFHFFPSVILQLGHLKYLTLRIEAGPSCPEFIIPRSIVNLSSLETLTLYSAHFHVTRVLLPDTVWKMKNLRRLKSKSSCWVLPADDDPEDLSRLENLLSFSDVELSSCQATKEVLRKFPNIRRLKCKLKLRKGVSEIVALDFLSQLESLSISASFFLEFCDYHYQFPHNLKKLTLGGGLGLPWSKISMIERLPNLEVLKLRHRSFTGENWDMEEDGSSFPCLRFLELSWLDLARWTSCSEDHFPCLKKLVLGGCWNLQELPSFLSEIPTIQMIKVINCKKIATDSIKTIEKRQKDFGNVDLDIQILRFSFE
ncbi:OLC1v1000583C3 [Oldenlandia corymbosa var. corymbosa]|nr:OLC1v1000583C3 [Oldenlandia corymbosa var. corymbosa]